MCSLGALGTPLYQQVQLQLVADRHQAGRVTSCAIYSNTPACIEVCALAVQHMLPNFNECWWDSWILDVAICNFIGEAAIKAPGIVRLCCMPTCVSQLARHDTAQ